jgi:succinyl-CoA synthetase alpha subunit
MSVLLDRRTTVLVQGITGHQGRFHANQMRAFGTQVVGGVTPGKGGTELDGFRVFDGVEEAVAATGATASTIFVPAPYARDAAVEAIEAGIRLLAIITERIPVHDCLELMPYARAKGATIIGPNCPGIATVGEAKMGIMPNHLFKPGRVGLISRSGTLTYEIVNELTMAGVGQSTCIGIGGDPILGTNMVEALDLFERDPATDAVVLVGEIGGTAEEEAAAKAKTMRKKVVAYVAGRTAPPGKKMGHAGAIVLRGRGTAESKIRAFEAAGVQVAAYPRDVPSLLG